MLERILWRLFRYEFYETRLGKWWCARRGHPCGVVWYTMSGSEPDYHCKNCGELL